MTIRGSILFGLGVLIGSAAFAVTVQGPIINAIKNQNTLQSGATFYVSSGTIVNVAVTTITFSDGTKQHTASNGGSGGGGYSVQPATVTFQLNKGVSTSTEIITSLSPGVMHIVATSSNVTTGLVSLSTEVTGSLPTASIAAGSLGLSVIASSIATSGVTTGTYGTATQVSSFTVAADGRITKATAVSISISTSGLNATGTASATTYLRGDNTWAVTGMTSNSTFYVQNTNTLQSGATFFVSSGTVNGQLTALSNTSSVVPLIVKGAANQSADYSQWISSAGTQFINITPSPNLVTITGVTPNDRMLILKMPPSPSSNALSIRDSTNADKFVFGPNGAGNKFDITSPNGSTRWEFFVDNTSGVQFGSLSNDPFFIFLNNVSRWEFLSTGDIIPYDAAHNFGSSSHPVATITAQALNLNAASLSSTPLIVEGAASQSANLQEWQNSSGVVLSSVTASGNGVFPQVTGSTVTASVSMQPPSKTVSQLSALVPNAAGLIFYCSDCTVDGIVVSTGTAAGSFARISARTTAIQ